MTVPQQKWIAGWPVQSWVGFVGGLAATSLSAAAVLLGGSGGRGRSSLRPSCAWWAHCRPARGGPIAVVPPA